MSCYYCGIAVSETHFYELKTKVKRKFSAILRCVKPQEFVRFSCEDEIVFSHAIAKFQDLVRFEE